MARKSNQPLWAPWFFLTPFLCVFGTFTVYPLFQALNLAMHQTYGPSTSRFVFLDNFYYLFRDPIFWKALRNTSVFAAGSVFIQLPLSLALAMMLNHPMIKGRAFFRLIFFTPSLFGIIFVGILFGLIFEKNTGLLNVVLNRLIGFPLEFPWLQEYSMAALILAALWMYVGFNMVYFLAALQGIDVELIEAAKIDGAGPWQRFVHIIIPQIKPVASFVVLLSLIGSFQLFELPWILFYPGGGGPNNAALTVVTYLYQKGFGVGNLGYASAIGCVLAVILIFFALGQRILTRESE